MHHFCVCVCKRLWLCSRTGCCVCLFWCPEFMFHAAVAATVAVHVRVCMFMILWQHFRFRYAILCCHMCVSLSLALCVCVCVYAPWLPTIIRFKACTTSTSLHMQNCLCTCVCVCVSCPMTSFIRPVGQPSGTVMTFIATESFLACFKTSTTMRNLKTFRLADFFLFRWPFDSQIKATKLILITSIWFLFVFVATD